MSIETSTNNSNPGWPKLLGEHDFYGVPVYRQRSVNAIRFNGIPRRAIHETTIDGLNPVRWYVNLKRARTLRVVFTGYVDRDRFSIPKFDRIRTSVASDDAFLAIGDPALEINDEIGLGWYVGTGSTATDEHIVKVIERVARQVNADDILLIGGSGGGFAALRFGALIDGASVYVFSPQTAISRYHRRHVQLMLRTSYPELGEDPDRFAESYPLRNEAAALYEKTGATTPVYYFQNSNDPFHTENHLQPFRARMEALEQKGARPAGALRVAMVDSVDGHGAPTPSEFEEHLILARKFFADTTKSMPPSLHAGTRKTTPARFYGVTRFSTYLPGNKAWLSAQLSEDEYQAHLFDDERLRRRAQIFFRYALPHYQAMADRHAYRHIVHYTDSLPEKWRDELHAAASRFPVVLLDNVTETLDSVETVRRHVATEHPDTDVVAWFRIDDDDILASSYLDRLSDYATPEHDGWAVSFGLGAGAMYDGQKFVNARRMLIHGPSQGQAYIGRFDARSESISFPRAINHHREDTVAPMICDSREYAFLQTFHEHQDQTYNTGHDALARHARYPAVEDADRLLKAFPSLDGSIDL